MTMLQIHATALSSKLASYHEFLSRYSKSAKVVYGFVEGKDDPCFYRGFIELLLPDEWDVELWPAGNKDQVYRIHSDLDWRRFPKWRVCFFVDRDLSDLIPERRATDTNIYVTTGYSIENDVVNKSTCQRTLLELCGFATADHSDMDRVCALFDQEYETFLKAMVPIMAWILAWRRNGSRPNLNDIQMRDLFSITKGRIQFNPAPKAKADVAEYLHDQCKVVVDPGIDTIPIADELSKKCLYRKLTRGKYVFWFLVEFCNTVHRDAIYLFKGFSKPPKMHVNFSCANGMAMVGTRARIPSSLKSFVKTTFCKYIEKFERIAA